MRILLIITTLFCYFPSTWALSKALFLGGHNIPGTYQVDNQGASDTYALDPLLGALLVIPVNQRFYLVPKTGLVLHNSAADSYGDQTKRDYFLHLDLSYKVLDRLIFHSGLGAIYTRITGKGGEVRIQNGSGYDTAYKPSRSVTVLNNSVNLGAEYFVLSNISLNLFTHFVMIFNGDKRAIGYSLYLASYF